MPPEERRPVGEEFGHRIRALRDRLCLTQMEVAVRTRLHPSAISHFECGRREPTVSTMVLFADEFGVPLDWLAGRVKQ